MSVGKRAGQQLRWYSTASCLSGIFKKRCSTGDSTPLYSSGARSLRVERRQGEDFIPFFFRTDQRVANETYELGDHGGGVCSCAVLNSAINGNATARKKVERITAAIAGADPFTPTKKKGGKRRAK